jgi:hypothetical protein
MDSGQQLNESKLSFDAFDSPILNAAKDPSLINDGSSSFNATSSDSNANSAQNSETVTNNKIYFS